MPDASAAGSFQILRQPRVRHSERPCMSWRVPWPQPVQTRTAATADIGTAIDFQESGIDGCIGRKIKFDDIQQACDHLGIIGERLGNGHTACFHRLHAGIDHAGGVCQQSTGNAFGQPEFMQVSNLLAQGGQLPGRRFRQAGFRSDDACLRIDVGVVEHQRHGTLFGTLLQVFHHTLVAGVVRHDHHEAIMGADHFAGFIHVQDATVIGQRSVQAYIYHGL